MNRRKFAKKTVTQYAIKAKWQVLKEILADVRYMSRIRVYDRRGTPIDKITAGQIDRHITGGAGE